MPRLNAFALLSIVLSFSIAGCSTPPATSTTSIDYTQQRYDGVQFKKLEVTQPKQAVSFKSDIDTCEAKAQQHYQESVFNNAKLSRVYGQAISAQALLKMKRMQVIDCMTGPQKTSENGEGWVIK